jgi:DNA-binding MarR family transcriptional regulator
MTDQATMNATGAESTAADIADFRLADFLPYRLSILSNTVSRAIARLYADRFGLAIPDWRIVAVLRAFGPSSQIEVCGHTLMDKVTVSRAVSRLLQAGLIVRETDPQDRRRAVLSLSADGRAVHQRIVPLARAREATLLAALSAEERAQLDRILRKLSACARTLDDGAFDAAPTDSAAG